MKTKPDKVVALLEALTEELRREAEAEPGPLYYDQTNSPLPRDTFLRLVRSGKVTGFKVNRLVLVKRSELHDFIEAHKVNPQLPFSQDNDAVVAAAMTQLGMKRAG
jgi:excisionase family DNA binding protein